MYVGATRRGSLLGQAAPQWMGQDSTDSAPSPSDVIQINASPISDVPADASTDGSVAAPAQSSTSGSWFTDVLNSVTKTVQTVAPVVMSVVQQNNLATVNQSRAKAGLPPLTAAQYQAQYGIPTATVQAQLAPTTTKTIYYIVGAAAAVALVIAFGKR